MSRVLALGVAIATGVVLLAGTGEALAQAAPTGSVERVNSSICPATVVAADAFLRATPDGPIVGIAPQGTVLWVSTAPVNGYLRVVPRDFPPPLPGSDEWIRQDQVQLMHC